MHIKKAHQYFNDQGLAFKKPIIYFGVNLYTGMKKDEYGSATEEITKILLVDGGDIHLRNVVIKFEMNGIYIHGVQASLIGQPIGDEFSGCERHVWQKWFFQTHLEKDEIAEYDAWWKKIKAKRNK